LVRLILLVVWNRQVFGNAQVRGSKVGKQRRLAADLSGRNAGADRVSGKALGTIQVTGVADGFAVKQIPSRLFVRAQNLLVRLREDPKSYPHRSLPASCCIGEEYNTVNKCNSAVSGDRIATVHDRLIYSEPIPDRKRWSH